MSSARHPRTRRKSLAELWGQNLRNRRQMIGVSQATVARAADIAQQSVARFEAGEQIPHDRTKLALARALLTTPGELFPWPPMDDLTDGAA